MTVSVDGQLRTGVPRDEPRLEGPRPPSHDVFVSYSTRDKPVADAVVSRLEQANIRCWVAPRDVVPGMVWAEAIIAAISTSRLMVVVLSGAANESPQVIREVERAVANGAVVIPFRIESVEPTGAMAYYLAGEHWLDAMNPPLESHIAQLVSVVRALLDRAPVAAHEALPTPLPAPSTRSRDRRSLRTGLLVAAGLFAAFGAAVLFGVFSDGTEDGTTPTPTLPAVAAPTDSDTPTPPASAVVSPAASVPIATPVASTGGGTAGVLTSVFDLAAGDCFGTNEGPLASVLVVECGQPHVYEVFALVYHDGAASAAYPGDDAMTEYADTACRVPFETYVGRDYATSAYWITTIAPSADTWAQGDREIVCTLRMGSEGEEVSGSAQGSGD